MQPFTTSEESLKLKDSFPDADLFRQVARAIERNEREGLCRLWLSEGIPFAFRHVPMVYEIMRDWLGRRLNVHPKRITLIGSARIGYSLSSVREYGRPFGPRSDLDLSVVSEHLFSEVSGEFAKWKSDLNEGLVKPRSNFERQCWEDNLKRFPINISRGFIDTYKIPNFPRYHKTQRIAQTMFLLCEKLKVTLHAPDVKRASVRAYRDWHAFVSRLAFNLEHLDSMAY